ncbi:unnamed protein product [Pleuronectes platessa]|uniref:Uncharacterized protein n=1 Tax=Pleuronectes platessa TaxID=8262 RepID=A0A9N7UH42_PLEPL|nr:unnamed protein product [Pleuronectes platessa]
MVRNKGRHTISKRESLFVLVGVPVSSPLQLAALGDSGANLTGGPMRVLSGHISGPARSLSPHRWRQENQERGSRGAWPPTHWKEELHLYLITSRPFCQDAVIQGEGSRRALVGAKCLGGGGCRGTVARPRSARSHKHERSDRSDSPGLLVMTVLGKTGC